eukprot:CAMPEP_0197909046 /NCGR_PEP_ID=MMETSP1439-20131203/68104_1 /TAXON_ID=66791 /ORGANISM="Gonyaulax spinifera, Strain CCMP409" /LENGTH=68 /DNA_ID=CAMNT_0043530591 /DNA_START=32 /DNA_END=235 /DNA_ORIENTATION=-
MAFETRDPRLTCYGDDEDEVTPVSMWDLFKEYNREVGTDQDVPTVNVSEVPGADCTSDVDDEQDDHGD